LARRPLALSTIGAVFRHNLQADAGAPWWNHRAIRYFTEQLRPGDHVFEWGSGSSTVWLVDHGATVTSVELSGTARISAAGQRACTRDIQSAS
jgi:hypothetical protein